MLSMKRKRNVLYSIPEGTESDAQCHCDAIQLAQHTRRKSEEQAQDIVEKTQGYEIVYRALQVLLQDSQPRGKFNFLELRMNKPMANSLYKIVHEQFGLGIEQTVFLDSPAIACIVTYVNWVLGEQCKYTGASVPIVLSSKGMTIVGVCCQLPSQIENFVQFKNVLRVGLTPDTRCIHLHLRDKHMKNQVLAGCLSEMQCFDHHFFTISPREAMFLDPKQRLLLEISYNAIKSSPHLMKDLSETVTSFLIGLWSIDSYSSILRADSHSTAVQIAGSSDALGAGRLAYFFDTNGPSMTVDTATSSAAVAVSLAHTYLKSEQAEIAVCASANILFSPRIFANLSRSRLLSPTGSCKAFDVAADGYLRSEAVVAMVCQQYSDNPLAFVRSSAVNQDGKSSGLLAPNRVAQTKLVAQSMQSRTLKFGQVECHGTGTAVGDSTELESVIETKQFSCTYPLIMHSVKTVFGHTEPSCGLVALFRTIANCQSVLTHLHISCLRGNFKQKFNITVPVVEMQRTSSFSGIRCIGFSGTNVHLISEIHSRGQSCRARPFCFLPLTAKSNNALARLRRTFVDLLQHSSLKVDNICNTVQHLHEPFKYRHAILGRKLSDIELQLQTEQLQSEGRVNGPDITLLFTCADTSYPYMGYELFKTSEIYFESFSQCCATIPLQNVVFPQNRCRSTLGHNILGDHASLLFLQFALTQFIHLQWGIDPQIVLGHSSGEFGAAVAAGFISIEDAADLVLTRAQTFQSIANDGCRLACGCTKDQALKITCSYGLLFVSCINQPKQTVISGADTEIHDFSRLMKWLEFPVKCIGRVPSHSPLMANVYAPIAKAAQKIHYSSPIASFVSSIFARRITEMNANYWLIHMMDRIEFHRAVNYCTQTLKSKTFFELGPKPVLSNIVREIAHDAILLPSIVSSESNWFTLCCSLANLFQSGINITFRNDTSSLLTGAPLMQYSFEKVNCSGYNSSDQSKANTGIPEQEDRFEAPDIAQLESSVLSAVSSVIDRRAINRKLSFMDMGMDSTTLVEFQEELQKHVGTGVKLPLTLPFDHTTIPQVVSFLQSAYASKYGAQGEYVSRIDEYTVVIENLVCELLGFPTNFHVNHSSSFKDLGMDNESITKFFNRLQNAIGLEFELSPVLLFDCPNIQTLLRHLQSEIERSIHRHRKKGFQTTNLFSTLETSHAKVVGLSCCFPNASSSLQMLWKSLVTGHDAICWCPIERFNIDDFFDSDEDCECVIRKAAFLAKSLSLFDNSFFHISPREAIVMDPQQRLLIQNTWHALENSVVKDSDIRNSPTSIFVGLMNNEYCEYNLRNDSRPIDQFHITATNGSIASGRLAYFYGTHGVAMTINTACSSSLVALQAAYQNIGQAIASSSFSLVSGTDLICDPYSFVVRCKSRMLSPDSHCKTLDSDADGYVRGEGCATVILGCSARESSCIFANVVEAKVNQDGHSSGLTAPRGSAQQQLIRNVLDSVQNRKVDYSELHGTGTALGDPIEANAQHVVMTKYQEKVTNGSVKANFGHCEGAAGIAGLIKALITIKMSYIPLHRNFATLNKFINQKERMLLPIEGISLEIKNCTVSSLGMSGTNCFVCLNSIEPVIRRTQNIRSCCFLPVSGKSITSAMLLIDALQKYLRENSQILAVSQALCMRQHFEHRVAIVVHDVHELFQEFSKEQVTKRESNFSETCHLFTGQGAQYVAMGDQLSSENFTFQNTFSCMREICDISDGTVKFHVDKYEARTCSRMLQNSKFLQPTILCLEYALAKVWESWGVKPTVMIGHSLGEITAATVAEAINLDDAAMLTNVRGRVMQEFPGKLFALTIEHELAYLMTNNDIKCWLSCRNAPRSSTFTVMQSDIVLFQELVLQLEYKVKALNGYVSHNPLMANAANELFDAIRFMTFSVSKVPMISNVTCSPLTTFDANYWRNQITNPVNFHGCIRRSSLQYDISCYLEIGPDAVLQQLVSQCLPQCDTPLLLSSLRKSLFDMRSMVHSAAVLYTAGKDLKLLEMLPKDQILNICFVPNYVFDEKPYWIIPCKDAPGNELPIVSDNLNMRRKTGCHLTQITSYANRKISTVLNKNDIQKIDIRKLVMNAVKKILHLSDQYKIDCDQGFLEMGMTSVTAAEFDDELQNIFNPNIRIPELIAFNRPTVNTVVDFILPHVFGFEQKKSENQNTNTMHITKDIGGISVHTPDILIISAAAQLAHSRSLDMFWDSLVTGSDAVVDIPASHWEDTKYFEKILNTTSKILYVRKAALFWKQISLFDCSFFSILPSEAQYMDPHQRVLLQVTVHAVEYCNEDQNKNCAVFVGTTGSEYINLVRINEHQHPSLATGVISAGVISGRIAYYFGYCGEAVTIDTACSSALMAVNLAVSRLLATTYSVSSSIAAGIGLLVSLYSLVDRCSGRMLSLDGHCKTFDEYADGYVQGEGCGVVLLKKSQAANGFVNKANALANILGVAANQDGRSSGLTAPNGNAQHDVLQSTLNCASVDGSQVRYIEAHGTGTSLGDPIETFALHDIYGNRVTNLTLGTAKVNLGHCEGAAGIVGFLKTAQLLHKSYTPMHRNFAIPNNKLNFQAMKIVLPATGFFLNPQPHIIGGVSSFGVSGTNVHCIMQQNVSIKQPPQATSINLMPYSAKNRTALKKVFESWLAFLENGCEAHNVLMLSQALCKREHFNERYCIATSNFDDLIYQLSHIDVTHFQHNTSSETICHLFTGQGAQYIGMGNQLLTENKEYETSYTNLCKISGLSTERYQFEGVENEMKTCSKLLQSSKVLQPILFCLGYTLAKVWARWGVKPTIMMGHSLGEIIAATVADAINPDDAALLTTVRGKVMQDCAGQMFALNIEHDSAYLITINDIKCWLSCRNAPRSSAFTVLQSYTQLFCGLVQQLEYKVKGLNGYVSHNPLMKNAANQLFDAIKSMTFNVSKVPIISNLSCSPLTMFDANYWKNQITKQVNFHGCITSSLQHDINCYLEIGPDPVLQPLVSQCMRQGNRLLLSSLRKSLPDLTSMFISATQLFIAGKDLQFEKICHTNELYDIWLLPNYPFEEKPYWISYVERDKAEASTCNIHEENERFLLLGRMNQIPLEDTVYFEKLISTSDSKLQFLLDHVVGKRCIFPGAGYIDIMLSATITLSSSSGSCRGLLLENLSMLYPLYLDEQNHVLLQTWCEVDPATRNKYNISIYSLGLTNAWQLHAQGNCTLQENVAIDSKCLSEHEKFTSTTNKDDIYGKLADLGYQYGETFQGISYAHTNDSEAEAYIVNPIYRDNSFILHPGLCDSMFQTCFLMNVPESTHVPFSIGTLKVLVTIPENITVVARSLTLNQSMKRGSIIALDENAVPFLCVTKFDSIRLVSESHVMSQHVAYDLFWARSHTFSTKPSPQGTIFFFMFDNKYLKQALVYKKSVPQNLVWKRIQGGKIRHITSISKQCNSFIFFESNGTYLSVLLECFKLLKENSELRNMCFGTAETMSCKLLSNPTIETCIIPALLKCFILETNAIASFLILTSRCTLNSIVSHISTLTLNNKFNVLLFGESNIYIQQLIKCNDCYIISHFNMVEKQTKFSAFVTGGTSGVGFHVAVKYYSDSHDSVTMFGRRQTKEEYQDLIAYLRSSCAAVYTTTSDILLQNNFGVVFQHTVNFKVAISHAAAVTDDKLIFSTDFRAINKIINAKAIGAVHCQVITSRLECHHMIYFSSAATFLGNYGQGGYACANATLDNFATSGVLHGHRVISIAWSNWSNVGLAAHLRGILAKQGFAEMAVDDGIRCLQHALATQSIFVSYINANWHDLLLHRHMLEDFLKSVFQKPPTAYNDAKTNYRESHLGVVSRKTNQSSNLRAADMNIKDLVVNVIKSILHLNKVNNDQEFFEMGMSSLTSIEFRNMLQDAFNGQIDIPITIIYDYPTISEVVTFLKNHEQVNEDHNIRLEHSKSTMHDEENVREQNTVSIIGLSLILPKTCTSPAAFWNSLREGEDCISKIPNERFQFKQYEILHKNSTHAYMKKAAFVRRSIYLFDRYFFNISKQEARVMDPQQRLMLQYSWQSLESSGLRMQHINKSHLGVYIGCADTEYPKNWSSITKDKLLQMDEPMLVDFGNTGILSGRVSFFLGSTGPTMTINSACASSAVALYLARNELLSSSPSDESLVAGSELLFDPFIRTAQYKCNWFSEDFHVKAFDDAGDGFAIGEGCVVFVLKASPQKLDNAFATISGIELNHDGRSTHLLGPRGYSHQYTVQTLLRQVDRVNIAYSEMHGQGNVMGDSIELQNMCRAFETTQQSMVIGTVNANVGVLEGASTAVKIVKLLLSMKNSYIPMHRNWCIFNRRVKGSNVLVELPLEGFYTKDDISCSLTQFSAAGTNCFAIFANREQNHHSNSTIIQTEFFLPFSAKSYFSLQEQLKAIRSYILDNPTQNTLISLRSSLQSRALFNHRDIIIAKNCATLLEHLCGTLQSHQNDVNIERKKICTLFEGERSAHLEMGVQLAAQSVFFNNEMCNMRQQCGAINNAQQVEENNLCSILHLLFLEVGLSNLWAHWGIRPSLTMGYGIGEIVAAVTAGTISFTDAIFMISALSKIGPLEPDTCELSIDAELLASVMPHCPFNLGLISKDSPRNSVVSVAENLSSLVVDLFNEFAHNVHQVTNLQSNRLCNANSEMFFEAVRTVHFNTSTVPMISTITGSVINCLDASYWKNHITQPINFTDSIKLSQQMNINCYLEIGPDDRLRKSVSQNLVDETALLLCSLDLSMNDLTCMFTSVSQLYCSGENIKCHNLGQMDVKNVWQVPSYCFDEQEYYIVPLDDEQSLADKKQVQDAKEITRTNKNDFKDSLAFFLHLSQSHSPVCRTLQEYLNKRVKVRFFDNLLFMGSHGTNGQVRCGPVNFPTLVAHELNGQTLKPILGGDSLGGTLAYQVATLVEQSHCASTCLIIFDSMEQNEILDDKQLGLLCQDPFITSTKHTKLFLFSSPDKRKRDFDNWTQLLGVHVSADEMESGLWSGKVLAKVNAIVAERNYCCNE